MNYMDFQPHLIRERNEQVKREVNSLRLEDRLREDRGSSGSRFVALARMGVMPLVRAARKVASPPLRHSVVVIVAYRLRAPRA